MLLAMALQAFTLLTRAHAHNDYAHTHPLEDALAQGFCSVEADIFLVDGELRVGHDRQDLRPGKTLEKLYLAPLLARTKENHGHVYPEKAEVSLLIDIKEDGEAVWKRLSTVLEGYKGMLTSFADGKVKKSAVTVVLSGDRPIATLAALKSRRAFIDGRLPDLDSNPPATLVPWVSASFSDTFKTNSIDLTPDQRQRLHDIVTKAHAQGRKVRFWAAPDNKAGWAMLDKAGVDLINTDDLAGLRGYFVPGG